MPTPRPGSNRELRRLALLLVPHWLHSLLHWLHWGDVPAYLGAGVSIWFGILSRRSSRRSKTAELEAKQQAEHATKAAQEATAAQKAIAGETKRMADAMEERSTQQPQDGRPRRYDQSAVVRGSD